MQRYETEMNNIAQAKGLHNLPKKDLNQIAQDLGLTNLKKNELVSMILAQGTLEILNHPTIESNPILKEVILGFFESFNPGKPSSYNAQSQQQQSSYQQQQQLQLLQAVEMCQSSSKPFFLNTFQYI